MNEYLNKVYPNNLQWKHVRLGQVPDVDEARLYQVTLRYADAIVKVGEKLVIVETKIKANGGVVGQLEHYKELIAVTPAFHEFRLLPVELEVVTTLEDRNLRSFVEGKNMKFIVFAPEWVADYWKERNL